jgi:glycosyltransferase involved in cell wall biosynthesis
MPEVSVIIPNYNHGRYLKQRIDSVLSQSFRDFEIIILDDASTDNSLEIIEVYKTNPRVSAVVVNRKNSGSTFYQWEKGISMASAEWIWIAESDDYASVDFLMELMPLSDSNVGLKFSLSNFVNEENESIQYIKQLEFPERRVEIAGIDFINRYMCEWNNIPNASAVLFRKSIYKKCPKDYFKLKLSGDWMLWLELIKNCNVMILSDKLNNFRIHQNTVRRKTSYAVFHLEHIFILNRLVTFKHIQAENIYQLRNEKLKAIYASPRRIFNRKVINRYGLKILTLYASLLYGSLRSQLSKIEMSFKTI